MSRSGVFLLVGLLCGTVTGGVMAYNLNPKLDEYTSTIDQLSEQYEALEKQYQDQYTELIDQKTERYSLQNEVNVLNNQLTQEISQHETTTSYLEDLSDSVKEFNQTLVACTRLQPAFNRVLNSDEIDKIGDKVREVVGGSDLWKANEKIYYFVADEVVYAYDVPIPMIGRYTYITEDGERVIVGFESFSVNNYIQPLNYTLGYMQGDCDDQAVLQYAMMRYYYREIEGTDYNLVLARVKWGDDMSHLAVFSPIEGGNICILDPAGHYLTNKRGDIATKEAAQELEGYQEHWYDENGDITEIKLYWVNIDDGTSTIVFDGDLDETINFFEER